MRIIANPDYLSFLVTAKLPQISAPSIFGAETCV